MHCSIRAIHVHRITCHRQNRVHSSMANRGRKPASGKVHKSAVILMPREDTWGPVQSIRAIHDKGYERWMPHVNLLYPFYPVERFEDSLQAAVQALRTVDPFDVTLGQFGFFNHRVRQPTGWTKLRGSVPAPHDLAADPVLPPTRNPRLSG